jgi:glutamyl/glutaminyl-tRNA synthetase
MNVNALKHFILSQGASRRVITMEWDKFWAENKRVLEDECPRYMGVNTTDMVLFTITNVEPEEVAVSVQIHPQKPELGNRVMRRYHKVYVMLCCVMLCYVMNVNEYCHVIMNIVMSYSIQRTLNTSSILCNNISLISIILI